MVARLALADVVEPRPDEQQIRARHPAGQGRGVGGRLAEVAIDREPVERVALRAAAGRGPFRQDPLDQPALIERLEHGHGAVAGAEQGDERARASSGHRPSSSRALSAIRLSEDRSIGTASCAPRRQPREDERGIGADVGLGVDMQRAVA